MPKPNLSIIIPCFNEGSRIISVVSQSKKITLPTEIIVVDDGSDPATRKILNNIKGIILVRHPYNLGKSQALKSGIKKARGNIILFLDADLIGLKPSHISQMIEPVQKNQCDITLSFRDQEAWYGILSGFAIAYTGERALRRSIIQKHLTIFNYSDYLVEPAFNHLFFNHYRVRGVRLKGVGQISQPQKNGIRGWFINFGQVIDYIHYFGLREIIRQMLFVKKSKFLIN